MPLKFAVGVNRTLVPEIDTMPPTALLTAVTVRAWPDLLAGPEELFPVSDAKLIVRWPESSATLESASSAATGASFTSVTVKAAVPIVDLKSADPFVVPLSRTV